MAMTTQGYSYEGTAHLVVAESALKNYNQSIANMIVRYAGGAAHVLDFGAGIGSLALRVRAMKLNPSCLEPDGAQRAELERRGFRSVASLAEIPDASLDYIYSSNVLEHIEDDVQALVELRNKLRPGGRIFLYLPAFQSIFSSLDEAVGHFRRYDRAMLQAKAREAGFDVEALYYADFFGYFMTRLFKASGNNMGNANPVTLRIFDRLIFPVGRLIERVVRVPVGKNVVAVARKP